MWRLNNQLIIEEIKSYLQTKENENTTNQNLWDTAEAVLRWKFTAIKDTSGSKKTKNRKNPQINNLTLQLNQPEKEEQIKPKISRRKEIRGQSRNK